MTRHELLAALAAAPGVTGAVFLGDPTPIPDFGGEGWNIPVRYVAIVDGLKAESQVVMSVLGADVETGEAYWAGKVPLPLRPAPVPVVPIATEADVLAYVNGKIHGKYPGQRVIDPRLDINDKRVLIRGYFPIGVDADGVGLRKEDTYLLYPKDPTKPATGNNIAYDRVAVETEPVV